MRNKGLAIAIVIIAILVLAIVYLTLVGPRLQGYVINKQVEGYNIGANQVIQQIIQMAERDEFVNLGTEENPYVLIKPSYCNRLLQQTG